MARIRYARPVTPEELDLCTKSLIGHQLMSAEKIDYSWFFSFGSDISIATEDAWRLIVGDRIFVTSEDHGEQFGLPEPVDAASRVLSSTIGRHADVSGPTRRY